MIINFFSSLIFHLNHGVFKQIFLIVIFMINGDSKLSGLGNGHVHPIIHLLIVPAGRRGHKLLIDLIATLNTLRRLWHQHSFLEHLDQNIKSLLSSICVRNECFQHLGIVFRSLFICYRQTPKPLVLPRPFFFVLIQFPLEKRLFKKESFDFSVSFWAHYAN